jgi:hypothetical protein
MDDDTWGYFTGSDGVPSDDVSPYLGAIDDTTPLDEDAQDATILNNPPQPTTGSTLYYGGAYRKQLDAVTANNCRYYNRAGSLLNALAGVPSVRSLSPLDTGVLGNAAGVGLQVRVLGKVGTVWTPQWLNVNGTTTSSDVLGGAVSFDALSVYRWEAALNGLPTVFAGDVGCFIGTQLVFVFRGTLDPRRGIPGKGNQMGSAEISIAVADSKNTTIGAADRLTAPADVSAFDPAVYFGGNSFWAGSDQSLAMPSGPYVQDDYCGYAVCFEALHGIPGPLGAFQVDVGVICND